MEKSPGRGGVSKQVMNVVKGVKVSLDRFRGEVLGLKSESR